jgi:IS5 family transposase
MNKIKKVKTSLFGEFYKLKVLSSLNDPLEKINNSIDWQVFKPLLEKIIKRENNNGKGGRPSYDLVMMFKILMLQSFNNISDDKIEYVINDRLSFQRFLGLTLDDRVPDAKTIWQFKHLLSKEDGIKRLFDLFEAQLDEKGIIAHKGSLVDASFVKVPIQRNSREENEKIKKGKTESSFKANPNKLSQKDIDARWAKKSSKSYYGYKNHIKADSKTKLITNYLVTNASTNDGEKIDELIDEKDNVIYADSAYVGKGIEDRIKDKNPFVELKICKRGYINHPLTNEDKLENKSKSRIRCRVEHIFGHMKKAMNGTNITTIGTNRAKTQIGLKNLAYNIQRFSYLYAISVLKTG